MVKEVRAVKLGNQFVWAEVWLSNGYIQKLSLEQCEYLGLDLGKLNYTVVLEYFNKDYVNSEGWIITRNESNTYLEQSFVDMDNIQLLKSIISVANKTVKTTKYEVKELAVLWEDIYNYSKEKHEKTLLFVRVYTACGKKYDMNIQDYLNLGLSIEGLDEINCYTFDGMFITSAEHLANDYSESAPLCDNNFVKAVYNFRKNKGKWDGKFKPITKEILEDEKDLINVYKYYVRPQHVKGLVKDYLENCKGKDVNFFEGLDKKQVSYLKELIRWGSLYPVRGLSANDPLQFMRIYGRNIDMYYEGLEVSGPPRGLTCSCGSKVRFKHLVSDKDTTSSFCMQCIGNLGLPFEDIDLLNRLHLAVYRELVTIRYTNISGIQSMTKEEKEWFKRRLVQEKESEIYYKHVPLKDGYKLPRHMSEILYENLRVSFVDSLLVPLDDVGLQTPYYVYRHNTESECDFFRG